MRTASIAVLWVISYICEVRQLMMECQPTQRLLEEMYNGTTDEFRIWIGSVTSKVECLYLCYYDFRCITFQYAQNGQCYKFSASVDTPKDWATDSGLDHVAYQLQGRGGFGENCTLNSECKFPNSECRESTCGCILGYSFNPMQPACTHGCSVYSKSYQYFPETQLFGMDFGLFITNNQEDCGNICSNLTNCKSFDYFSRECYPKTGGVLDSPFSVHQGLTTHAVRNCFN